MKIDRVALLGELESVQPGLTSREILEQTTCFAFHSGEVMTFNTEIACAHPTKLDIEGAVPATPLLNILRQLTEDSLEITAKDSELVIEGVSKRVEIHFDKEVVKHHEDKIERPSKWRKLPDSFADAIALVQECVSRDESTYPLSRIHLHPEFMEACDSDQLARYHIKLPIRSPTLVHKDSLKHVAALGITHMSVTSHWLHFKNPNGLVYSCRQSPDEYHDLDKIIDFKGRSARLPSGFKEAAERAQVFSNDNLEDDNVLITIKDGRSEIRGEGSLGRYRERATVNYKGPPLKFRISPVLLMTVIEKHNDCAIAKTRLKVEEENFTYVLSLGDV